MAGNNLPVKVKIDNVVKKYSGRNGEMVALNGGNINAEDALIDGHDQHEERSNEDHDYLCLLANARASVVTAFVLWTVIASTEAGGVVFAEPWEVGQQFVKALSNGTLWQHTSISLFRVLAGFVVQHFTSYVWFSKGVEHQPLIGFDPFLVERVHPKQTPGNRARCHEETVKLPKCILIQPVGGQTDAGYPALRMCADGRILICRTDAEI